MQLNGIIIMAIKVASNGVAGSEDIDRVWMINTQSNSGPFGWLDKKGIDTFLDEIESEERDFLYPEYDREQVSRFLNPFIKKGHIGEDAGQGIYTYPDPAYQEAAFLLNPFQE